MQTPATKVWCVLAMAVLTTACGLAQSQDDPSNDAHFEALSQCLDVVEKEVGESLVNPPPFESIEDAVTWARTSLRGELGAAFAQAGVTVRKLVSDQDLQESIKDRKQFERDLYSAITEQLHKFKRCEDGTSIAVVDKLKDAIYFRLRLGDAEMGHQFAQLGRGDSSDVKIAFLLMMTLDAAGVRWNPAIFANVPVRDDT